MLGSPVLRCEGLRKSYGERVAVDGVGFSVAAGECYGLLGPNGAGKTTTMSIVCGLLARDGGQVTVAGEQVDHRSVAARRLIGYVPQEIALYPDLSAAENLAFFGRLQGLAAAELGPRVAWALEAVGLTDRAGDRVERYSGGMKRRANLAVGLLHRPALLAVDEPTVGVDPQSRFAIFELVERMCAEGMGVLYTTHYMEEAERLCDRIGIIDQGRLVAEGTRRQLVGQTAAGDRLRVAAAGDLEALAGALSRLDEVQAAEVRDDGVELVVPEGRRLLGTVLRTAEAAGVRVDGVEVAEPDLEAVFLQLTGKALRD